MNRHEEACIKCKWLYSTIFSSDYFGGKLAYKLCLSCWREFVFGNQVEFCMWKQASDAELFDLANKVIEDWVNGKL